jgi:hypothetical protein
MPWSIETEVAPVTFHDNVEEPPLIICLGLAVKVFIIGKPDAVTVMVTGTATETEPMVAVSV